MSDLLQLLSRQLEGRVGAIGQQIGADPTSTEKGIEMALPLLMGALANNAARPEGAHQLSRALDRDHSPDLLDQLGGLLGGGGGGAGGGALGGLLGGLLGGGGAAGGGRGSAGGGLGSLLEGLAGGGARPAGLPKSLDGPGILGHILGPKRGAVQQGIERGSGLKSQQVMKLLVLLAPLVMSALSKVKQQQKLDDNGLASVLRNQRTQMEQRTPQLGGRGFADLLDQNNDGSIADDLARIGTSLGGQLFGRR
jgi:hypothetical protein